jgi:hypothetical protein
VVDREAAGAIKRIGFVFTSGAEQWLLFLLSNSRKWEAANVTGYGGQSFEGSETFFANAYPARIGEQLAADAASRG